MNAVQDLLFQQMQMLAAGMSLPQATGSTGKDSFQSVMDQTRGETQTAKEPEKQQKPEDTEKTEPVQEKRPAEEEEQETDPIRLQDACSAMGVMQLFRVVPQETEEPQEEPALVEAISLETDIPVETAAEPLPVVELPEESQEPVPEVPEARELEVQPELAPETETAELPQMEVQVSEGPAEAVDRPVEVRETEDEEPEIQADLEPSEPLFREVKSTPVKVGETYELDTRAEDLEARLAESIRQGVQEGVQRVELRLNPANLGALTIELTRSGEGLLQVVLHTENSRAAGILSEHLGGLHTALESLGQNQVQVEVQRHQESQSSQQHPFQQADPNGHGQRQSQRERQQERQSSPEDFLQQLRLGLVGEDEAI